MKYNAFADYVTPTPKPKPKPSRRNSERLCNFHLLGREHRSASLRPRLCLQRSRELMAHGRDYNLTHKLHIMFGGGKKKK